MRTVIVCGGRNYGDRARVYAYLSRLSKPFRIVTGGASGADTFAEQWARENQVECAVVRADWTEHGRAAGPMRNQKMLDDYKPCAVIAFAGGDGTRDMKRRARIALVPVFEPDAPRT